jgi:hypothetical protein
MRLAALNTRRASRPRARYAPRAIPVAVLGYPRGLLLLALTSLSALRRGWLWIRISSESTHSSPIAASPGDPLPLELSSRRRFPPVPLLRFDVDGVVADVAGSAASVSGLE